SGALPPGNRVCGRERRVRDPGAHLADGAQGARGLRRRPELLGASPVDSGESVMLSYRASRLLFGLVGCACSLDLQGSATLDGGAPSDGSGGPTSTVHWPSDSSEPPSGADPAAGICPFDWVTREGGGLGGASAGF